MVLALIRLLLSMKRILGTICPFLKREKNNTLKEKKEEAESCLRTWETFKKDGWEKFMIFLMEININEFLMIKFFDFINGKYLKRYGLW